MLTTLILWGLLGLLGQGVRAIIGLQSAGLRGQDYQSQGQEKKAKSCVRPFNYETCLKQAAATALKKGEKK